MKYFQYLLVILFVNLAVLAAVSFVAYATNPAPKTWLHVAQMGLLLGLIVTVGVVQWAMVELFIMDYTPKVPRLAWHLLLPSTGMPGLWLGMVTYEWGNVYLLTFLMMVSAAATCYGFWLFQWSDDQKDMEDPDLKLDTIAWEETLDPSEAPTRSHERKRCIHDDDGVFSC